MASTSSSPCAACKFLRRKCQPECVFAPYFPPDQPQKFANVHKVFGASNVTKLLNELHPHQREDAVNSLAYEADMRLRDPVYGCVGVISLLQHQLRQLQLDLSSARHQLSKYQSLTFPGPSTAGGCSLTGGGGQQSSVVLSTAAALAASASANPPSPLHGIGLVGGRGDHHHQQLYSQHQFFPQSGGGINCGLRGFEMAAGGGGGGGYDGGLLGINMNVSAASGLGQLGQLQQQPAARAAGGDDRRSIDPS